jgi:hypothetical protein
VNRTLVKPDPPPRVKRDAGTGYKTNCGCKLEDLIIDFKAMDWSWVVLPVNFNIGICTGTCVRCQAGPKLEKSMHAFLIENYKKSKKDFNHWSVFGACVPREVEPVTFILQPPDNQNVQLIKTIYDVQATACGCL